MNTNIELHQNMLFLPAGEFNMGVSVEQADQFANYFLNLPAGNNPYLFYNEIPAHPMKIKAFLISKTEISNQEYFEFIEAGGYQKSEYWKELIAAKDLNLPGAGFDRVQSFIDQTGNTGPSTWKNGKYADGKANHAVEGVSWFEAVAYCRWKKVRLPNESEWEYAARGTDQRIFPWGNGYDVLKEIQTGAAAKKDRSPFGVCDLATNVSEWVNDSWTLYPGCPLATQTYDEPMGIVRGGNVYSSSYERLTTFRRMLSKVDRLPGVGFRCAADSIKQ
jgi:formylglycine-generating enzyme required for sulfatase activity